MSKLIVADTVVRSDGRRTNHEFDAKQVEKTIQLWMAPGSLARGLIQALTISSLPKPLQDTKYIGQYFN